MRIYCDFSGYSDMAVGLGHLFGYKLTNNFNMPYLATNVTDFWRRWHISLSTWLRDYVFIPLGGSRGGKWLTYRNLLITMTLGGLWHGAAWGYVLWGMAHGLLLIVHKQFQDFCAGNPRLNDVCQSAPGTVVRVLLTFVTVSLCWVLFQPDFGKAIELYRQLFQIHLGQPLPLSNRSLWYTAAFVLGCHLLVRSGWWRIIYDRLPSPVLGFGYAACLCTALLLAPDSSTAFLYFQF
jgi:D-alanyl-lipoteichoic acid acyltransferase DltB (MBOAT superfamily)